MDDLGSPKLISGHVDKGDVFAYFTRRKESEIVVDPIKVKQQTTVTIRIPTAHEDGT